MLGVYSLLGILTLAFVTSAAANSEPDLSAWSDEQKEDFLRTATIVSGEPLESCVPGVRMILLEKAGVQHYAHVDADDGRRLTSDLDTCLRNWANRPRFADEGPFDSGALTCEPVKTYSPKLRHRLNVAAYRIARLIGFDRVPVSVQRELDGEPASFTWELDRPHTTLRQFRRCGPPAGSLQRKADDQEVRNAFLFTILMGDPAPNTAFLVDDRRQVHVSGLSAQLAPSTGPSFGRSLLGRTGMTASVPRWFYEGLLQLTPDVAERELSDVLKRQELRRLMSNRNRLLKEIAQQAKTEGWEAASSDHPSR